jgi:high-affinity Fe2+/Pb2+ permease
MNMDHLREYHPSTPLVKATGQLSGLAFSGAAMALGLAACVSSAGLLNYGYGSGFILFAVGATLLLVSPIYAIRHVKCPRCKIRWVQYAMGQKNASGWLVWLISFTECPECGLSTGDLARRGVASDRSPSTGSSDQ